MKTKSKFKQHFFKIGLGVFQAEYNLICQDLSKSVSKGEMKVVNAMWWYYISKAYELLDTFWMVIRKKNDQISFLHVLHHSSIVIFVSILNEIILN
jgi:elongation of very long chain fatty acids protein 4